MNAYLGNCKFKGLLKECGVVMAVCAFVCGYTCVFWEVIWVKRGRRNGGR